MELLKTEVIRDAKYTEVTEVLTRIYSVENDNTLGVCEVKIDKRGTAEIYSVQILDESNRRKHYGSKLWKFTENYVINTHHPNRFIGELHPENSPAIEFWKNHNFQINFSGNHCGTITKSVEY